MKGSWDIHGIIMGYFLWSHGIFSLIPWDPTGWWDEFYINVSWLFYDYNMIYKGDSFSFSTWRQTHGQKTSVLIKSALQTKMNCWKILLMIWRHRATAIVKWSDQLLDSKQKPRRIQDIAIIYSWLDHGALVGLWNWWPDQHQPWAVWCRVCEMSTMDSLWTLWSDNWSLSGWEEIIGDDDRGDRACRPMLTTPPITVTQSILLNNHNHRVLTISWQFEGMCLL